MMYETLLEEIGLSKSEVAAYFALLEIGSSTTGPIIKKAQIASGKAYLVLDRLITKGLVTYSIKSGVKSYQAKDPSRLLEYMKDKESELRDKVSELEKIVPVLKSRYDEQKYKPMVEVYEGTKAFKTFHEWLLGITASGECVNIMGIPRVALEKFNAYFLDWNRRRVARGVRMRIIYNSDCRNYGREREKMKLTEVRYMKPELQTPAWLDIYRDYVVTMDAHSTPVCFLIKNKESAESYMQYFEMVWKQSAKT
jgi:sugar-specific transcriptional regulator TrmB